MRVYISMNNLRNHAPFPSPPPVTPPPYISDTTHSPPPSQTSNISDTYPAPQAGPGSPHVRPLQLMRQRNGSVRVWEGEDVQDSAVELHVSADGVDSVSFAERSVTWEVMNSVFRNSSGGSIVFKQANKGAANGVRRTFTPYEADNRVGRARGRGYHDVYLRFERAPNQPAGWISTILWIDWMHGR